MLYNRDISSVDVTKKIVKNVTLAPNWHFLHNWKSHYLLNKRFKTTENDTKKAITQKAQVPQKKTKWKVNNYWTFKLLKWSIFSQMKQIIVNSSFGCVGQNPISHFMKFNYLESLNKLESGFIFSLKYKVFFISQKCLSWNFKFSCYIFRCMFYSWRKFSLLWKAVIRYTTTWSIICKIW